MVGWHHWLNGHEFEQAPGDDDGQGSLECCSPRRCKSQTRLSEQQESSQTTVHLPCKTPRVPQEQKLQGFWGLSFQFSHSGWNGPIQKRYFNVKACVHAKLLQLCPTHCNPMDCSCQGPLPVEFSRQEYWSGLPCPLLGDLPDPGDYFAGVAVFLFWGRTFWVSLEAGTWLGVPRCSVYEFVFYWWWLRAEWLHFSCK